ncbi:MAG: flavin prenyltransferase UbiX [Mariprofundaceae bacterium]|nr:flavin prenyltransferase UbiX [Mariprofundaceae bacterium]
MSNTQTTEHKKRQIIVGITGASGAAYGLRLIEKLVAADVMVHVLLSDAARVVLKQECDLCLPEDQQGTVETLAQAIGCTSDNLRSYGTLDWFSPAASGSSGIEQMVVIPCSMGTLASIAHGMSNHLLERAADVMLKERKQLILMPRETPLSAIHLEHMLKLARLGVDIIPAMPGFYHRPTTLDELIDFMVSRVLDHLKVDNKIAQRWGMGE